MENVRTWTHANITYMHITHCGGCYKIKHTELKLIIFQTKNEEREDTASGDGEPTRGADSDTTDDCDWAGENKKKYYLQPQWLTQYLCLQYEGNAILCEYCRQWGLSTAGSSKLVNSSTQLSLKTLKLHNDSKWHKTCWDWCMTHNTEPLPTSSQQLDESSRSAEEKEMVIKFSTAYAIAKEFIHI